MRWLTIAVALTALVLVGAGCGGDDEAASDTTTLSDTTTDETTTDETTTDETTTDEATTDDTDLSGVLADEDCLALAAAGASFAQAFAGGSSASEENAFEELANQVPDEIEADVRVLAEAYADYAAELEGIGLEEGQTPSAEQLQQLQAALASFDSQAISAASERLSAWAQTNCPSG